jgi:hypothetical protein
VRDESTRERLLPLLRELARSAPAGGSWRVYLVGEATAVTMGWRRSSMDVGLFSEHAEVFRDIQSTRSDST